MTHPVLYDCRGVTMRMRVLRLRYSNYYVIKLTFSFSEVRLPQLKSGTVCHRPSSHRHHCRLSAVNYKLIFFNFDTLAWPFFWPFDRQRCSGPCSNVRYWWGHSKNICLLTYLLLIGLGICALTMLESRQCFSDVCMSVCLSVTNWKPLIRECCDLAETLCSGQP